MTGLNMQDFKEALKGNHEIEFLYKDKEILKIADDLPKEAGNLKINAIP